MASNEDMDCLGSICQALRDVVCSAMGISSSESETEVRDLLSLMPAVFAADVHAGRTAQLLQTCHPLSVAALLLQPRCLCSSALRVAAMKTISAIVSTPAVLHDPTQRLRALVGDQLTEASLAALLLQSVVKSHHAAEVVAAAELLFVLTMTVRSFRDDLRHVEDGIPLLVQRALQRPNAAQPQSFLIGVLRMLSESCADVLSAEHVLLLPKAMSALSSFYPPHPESVPAGSSSFGALLTRRAAVLLMETVTEVVRSFPSAYAAAASHHSEYAPDLPPLSESVRGAAESLLIRPAVSSAAAGSIGPTTGNEASEADCWGAAAAMLDQFLRIEGGMTARTALSSNRTPQPTLVYSILSDADLWKHSIAKAHAHRGPALIVVSLLRQAVFWAMSHATQVPLVHCFMEAFPTLCNSLVPERADPLCMREASLMVGLMLAKAPSTRKEVRRLVSGYEAWAAQLSARAVQVLRTLYALNGDMSAAAAGVAIEGAGDKSTPVTAASTLPLPIPLSECLIVDLYQTVLNDGDQAQHIDLLQESRIAKALLHEQQRRFTTNAPPAPLDTSFIDAFRDLDSSVTTRARDLCKRLALAVMEEAVVDAFTPSPVDATTEVDSQRPSTSAASPVRSQNTSAVGSAAGLAIRGVKRASHPPAHHPLPSSPSASLAAVAPSRYHEWLDQTFASQSQADKKVTTVFGPVRNKSPFRPSGRRRDATHSGFGSATERAKSPSTSVSVARRSRTPLTTLAATATSGGSVRRGAAHSDPAVAVSTLNQPLLEAVRDAPVASDEYLSLAIMLHLPIRFGPHYNRGARISVRKVSSPRGLMVQPLHRDVNQSWSASDVRVGELHVIFIPFQKLSCQRVEEEITAIDNHLIEMNKQLVTTPVVQKARRWFLRDMVSDILPKTELLLRDLLDLLYKFGADDVVYQLSLIRVADEGKRQSGDLFSQAVTLADTAMPAEVLRLSSGAFRDILHSGNLVFAVQQLRQYYYYEMPPQAAGSSTSGDVMVRDASNVAGSSGAAGSGPGATQAQWNALREVDAEIRALKQQEEALHANLHRPYPTSTLPSHTANPALSSPEPNPFRYVGEAGDGHAGNDAVPGAALSANSAASDVEEPLLSELAKYRRQLQQQPVMLPGRGGANHHHQFDADVDAMYRTVDDVPRREEDV